MSAQHTPGPWIATVEDTDIPGVAVRFSIDTLDAGKISICKGQSQEHLGADDAIWMGECKANARLIAAAPELLAALQLAYRHLNGGADSLTATEHAEAFRLSRAAIAKATGSAA
jgi:hypothetical protein